MSTRPKYRHRRSLRRKLLIALGAGTLASPLSLLAQPSTKVWRVGVLSSENAVGYKSRVDALRAGLREVGYEEGRNLVIDYRWAEGKLDRLDELAADLLRRNVDILITHAIAPTQAAKRATTAIPIVIAATADPVASGLVSSLGRPGGNITGFTFLPQELAAKRIELLKDTMPGIVRVAALFDPDAPITGKRYIEAMREAARTVKVTLGEFPAHSPRELDDIFKAMVDQRAGAVVVAENATLIAHAGEIAAAAAKRRIPSIGNREFAEAGGMIGYGADLLDLWRRTAGYVDRIFKGAKPADLPIQQPTKFDLIVNKKTAAALGIKIPNSILVRADKVIE